MPPSDFFSNVFGYVSIACWLCAQLPQSYKNFCLQSTEGLSILFLLNWYLGDCSNLIGCILTNQLPFQTWLAAYFVVIDTILLFQYFYYTQPTKPSHLYHERALPTTIREERTPSRYRTISAVAANVAAAAALVAQHDEQAGHTHRHVHRQRRHTEQPHDLTHESVLEESEEMPSKITDSFYSEGGHTSRQKRVSWSVERHRSRGGSLGRYSLMISPEARAPIVHDDDVPPILGTGQRRNSRAGRSSASLVFLGVWALFGLGGYASRGRSMPADFNRDHTKGMGRVVGAPMANSPLAIPIRQLSQNSQLQQRTSEINVTFQDNSESTHLHHIDTSNERFLGRIFAWICTIMYLTSRLPQIWKNYVRKSVEGLSISLFVFAFLGNTFYVASILVSPRFYLPPPLSTNYIRESVPYLLGSGGTLMSDIMIIAQFFAYRSHRHRHLDSQMSEETGLLTGAHISEHPSRGRTSHVKATE